MKIVAIKEKAQGETRVAITPDTAKLFVKKGYEVVVEKSIGIDANFSDDEYENAGAKVSSVPMEILSDADIILKVQPTPLSEKLNELELAKEGATIIGMLSPYSNSDYLKQSITRHLSTIAMELVPRITKAQSMDILSSQSNLAGYRAVIEACLHYQKSMPMMMTAAGTVHPAKVLVLGVGVAGLQAIATAKRLGAVVSAYDVRAATKEQVESLGGKFVYPKIESTDAEDKSGYAKELPKDFAAIQEKFLSEIIGQYDIVITTAQIPGKPAPVLVTENMVAQMKKGSVIIDMATSSGGNVKGSAKDKVVISKNEVTIVGHSNLATKLATESSKLYAKNLYNFLEYAVKDGKINFTDDLVEEMLLGKDGQIINKKFNL